jgi:hypothetical protein
MTAEQAFLQFSKKILKNIFFSVKSGSVTFIKQIFTATYYENYYAQILSFEIEYKICRLLFQHFFANLREDDGKMYVE